MLLIDNQRRTHCHAIAAQRPNDQTIFLSRLGAELAHFHAVKRLFTGFVRHELHRSDHPNPGHLPDEGVLRKLRELALQVGPHHRCMIKDALAYVDIDHFARHSTTQRMPAVGVTMTEYTDFCGRCVNAIGYVPLHDRRRNGHIGGG